MKRQTKQMFYHLHAKVFKRSDGDNFWQKLSYRDGNVYYDELTGKTFNHEAKKIKDGIQSEFIQVPWAKPELHDREKYFNELYVLEHERKDSQLFKDIEVGIPLEFSLEQRKETVRDFAKRYSELRGTPVYLNFHKLNSHNPHAHCVVPLRPIDRNTGGFGKKVQVNPKAKEKEIEEVRKMWADVINERAREYGIDATTTEKSYKTRGIDKIVQKHLPMKKKSREYKEAKLYNQQVDLSNRVNEVKEKFKEEVEVKKLEIDVKKSRKESLFIRKEMVTDFKKEVIPVAEQEKIESIRKKILEDVDFETDNSQEQIQTNEIENDFRKRYEDAVKKVRVIKEKQLKTKKLIAEKKTEFKTNKAKQIESRYTRKDKINNLKLDNELKKADMKETRKFSLEGYEQRRKLKAEIKRNKVSIQRQKIALKREKRQIREQRKDYMKERINGIQQKFSKTKANFTAIKNRVQLDKVVAIQVSEKQKQKQSNIVSLKDFKEQKQKLTFDRASMTKVKEVREMRKAGVRIAPNFEAFEKHNGYSLSDVVDRNARSTEESRRASADSRSQYY